MTKHTSRVPEIKPCPTERPSLAVEEVGQRTTPLINLPCKTGWAKSLVLLTRRTDAWEGNRLVAEHTAALGKGTLGRGTRHPGSLSLCFTLFPPQAGKIEPHPQGQACPSPLGKLAEGAADPLKALRARLPGSWQFYFMNIRHLIKPFGYLRQMGYTLGSIFCESRKGQCTG